MAYLLTGLLCLVLGYIWGNRSDSNKKAIRAESDYMDAMTMVKMLGIQLLIERCKDGSTSMNRLSPYSLHTVLDRVVLTTKSSDSSQRIQHQADILKNHD